MTSTAASPVAPGVVRTVRRARRRRIHVVCLALGAVLLTSLVASLATGEVPLTISDVVASLTGRGTRASDFIVYGLRLPRVLTGLAVGFAFGVAGAVFQTMLRNPLASPDIIGISSGASAAAVFALLVLKLSGASVAGFAFAGALLTALTIYLLAWRGGVAGNRLVLVGVGMAAVLYSVIDFLMTRAQVYEAQVALVWLTGSLNGADAASLRPVVGLLLLAIPLTVWATRALAGLQLGDDSARALGVGVERSRLLLILLAVALTAVATSAAGPVAFVAFVAAPVARRLTGDAGAGLLTAGLVGAAVVTLADFTGQHLLPVELPVGVLTAAVGAPYLIHLLLKTTTTAGSAGRG